MKQSIKSVAMACSLALVALLTGQAVADTQVSHMYVVNGRLVVDTEFTTSTVAAQEYIIDPWEHRRTDYEREPNFRRLRGVASFDALARFIKEHLGKTAGVYQVSLDGRPVTLKVIQAGVEFLVVATANSGASDKTDQTASQPTSREKTDESQPLLSGSKNPSE